MGILAMFIPYWLNKIAKMSKKLKEESDKISTQPIASNVAPTVVTESAGQAAFNNVSHQ
eukprot:TRINITY_DN3025_c0_g1_i1.p3 TRINITY_DN3025_c0_g1~~TRINITY_DN3025_c0_g1_i1.p3  ORF type:complete len:59 (-),score=27.45 TRINITY_DN3025_c0_g1_i1:41-217(-)